MQYSLLLGLALLLDSGLGYRLMANRPIHRELRASSSLPRALVPPCTFSPLRMCAAAEEGITEMPLRVLAKGCSSCEEEWLQRSKGTEGEEQLRLDELRATNHSAFVQEVWEYGQRMNDTMRQELALTPDMELRNFIINSCSPPTPLMETVYNNTMQRVPYEQACYICGPEQAILLRTLVGLARPRQCLDIGSFTGYTASAILEALPENADLTCLELERDFTRLAVESLAGRNVHFMVGPAMNALQAFESAGKQFDFISLDADKPMHGEYYNASLRLLRPGGMLVMFGMLLFPTIEDQEAMEKLHQILPNDTRITTAQLPVGCGIQLMVKQAPELLAKPRTEQVQEKRHRWQLESELAAIERLLDAFGKPVGGAAAVGPGIEALSSKGLVALAAARRAVEQPPPEE